MINRTKAAFGLAVATSLNAFAAADVPAVGDLRNVGRTHLQTSCSPAVQDDFASGLALLHSFFYEEARRVFTDVAARDRRCAIAHWGDRDDLVPPALDAAHRRRSWAAGRAAIGGRPIGGRRPTRAGARLHRRAGRVLRRGPRRLRRPAIGESATAPRADATTAARAAAYAQAMEAVLSSAPPDDTEAAAFYALALLASAPPADPELTQPARGGGDPGAALGRAPRPSRRRPLPDPRLRLPAARRARARRREGVRGHRALGAARAAHALAHLHAPGHVGGVHRRQPRFGRGRARLRRRAPPGRDERSRSCTRSTTWSTPTCRPAQDARARRSSSAWRRAQDAPRAATSRSPTRWAPMPARYALERRPGRRPPRWRRPPASRGRSSRSQAHVEFARALGAARSGDSRRGAQGRRAPARS